MAQHPLDRPVWHALQTRQTNLAQVSGNAACYDRRYTPFACGADDGPQALKGLEALMPAEGLAVLLQAGACPAPASAIVEVDTMGVQMVAWHMQEEDLPADVIALGDADAPEMRALAQLTKPGPFLELTHQLGPFLGIRQGGRLVAMAGERMKLDGFTEVSGVCTHPDHRGKGYAALLTRLVASNIAKRGEVPFLHAFASNAGAIRLYEQIGFSFRSEMGVKMYRRAT